MITIEKNTPFKKEKNMSYNIIQLQCKQYIIKEDDCLKEYSKREMTKEAKRKKDCDIYKLNINNGQDYHVGLFTCLIVSRVQKQYCQEYLSNSFMK